MIVIIISLRRTAYQGPLLQADKGGRVSTAIGACKSLLVVGPNHCGTSVRYNRGSSSDVAGSSGVGRVRVRSRPPPDPLSYLPGDFDSAFKGDRF
eukprot:2577063-Pyramimonas_sp.AAC.1